MNSVPLFLELDCLVLRSGLSSRARGPSADQGVRPTLHTNRPYLIGGCKRFAVKSVIISRHGLRTIIGRGVTISVAAELNRFYWIFE